MGSTCLFNSARAAYSLVCVETSALQYCIKRRLNWLLKLTSPPNSAMPRPDTARFQNSAVLLRLQASFRVYPIVALGAGQRGPSVSTILLASICQEADDNSSVDFA